MSRPASAIATRRAALKVLVAKAFADSDGTYGCAPSWPGGTSTPRPSSSAPSCETVAWSPGRLVACQPRPWRHSLTDAGPCGPNPDLVARDFTADAPGVKMVGDITYSAQSVVMCSSVGGSRVHADSGSGGRT